MRKHKTVWISQWVRDVRVRGQDVWVFNSVTSVDRANHCIVLNAPVCPSGQFFFTPAHSGILSRLTPRNDNYIIVNTSDYILNHIIIKLYNH